MNEQESLGLPACAHELALNATHADLVDQLAFSREEEAEPMFDALGVLTSNIRQSRRLLAGRQRLEHLADASFDTCTDQFPEGLLGEIDKAVNESVGFLSLFLRGVREVDGERPHEFVDESIDSCSSEDTELVDRLVQSLCELEEVTLRVRIEMSRFVDEEIDGIDKGSKFAELIRVRNRVSPHLGKHCEDGQGTRLDQLDLLRCMPVDPDPASEDCRSDVVEGAGESRASFEHGSNVSQPSDGLQMRVQPAFVCRSRISELRVRLQDSPLGQAVIKKLGRIRGLVHDPIMPSGRPVWSSRPQEDQR